MVDWDAYTHYFALESLVRHWDGYDWNMNNTYIYNDKEAKPDPDVKKGDINFKFIPSGIDQILGTRDTGILIGEKSILGSLTVNDEDAKAKLYDQIRKFADDIFVTKNLANSVHPFMDRELIVLKNAKASYSQGDIDGVKKQVDSIQSWAYAKVGSPK